MEFVFVPPDYQTLASPRSLCSFPYWGFPPDDPGGGLPLARTLWVVAREISVNALMHATNPMTGLRPPVHTLFHSCLALNCSSITHSPSQNEREKKLYMRRAFALPLPPPTFLLLPRFFLFSIFFSLLLAGFEHFHFHFLCTTSKSLSLHFGFQNARAHNGSRDFFRCRSAPFFRSGPRRNEKSHSFSFKISYT